MANPMPENDNHAGLRMARRLVMAAVLLTALFCGVYGSARAAGLIPTPSLTATVATSFATETVTPAPQAKATALIPLIPFTSTVGTNESLTTTPEVTNTHQITVARVETATSEPPTPIRNEPVNPSPSPAATETPTPTTPDIITKEYGQVITDTVKYYQYPFNTSAKVTGMLPLRRGDAAEIRALTATGFMKILVTDANRNVKFVWIKSETVKTFDQQYRHVDQYKVTTALHLRQSPSTRGAILATIPENDLVNMDGESVNGWVPVSWVNPQHILTPGYVASQYLSGPVGTVIEPFGEGGGISLAELLQEAQGIYPIVTRIEIQGDQPVALDSEGNVVAKRVLDIWQSNRPKAVPTTVVTPTQQVTATQPINATTVLITPSQEGANSVVTPTPTEQPSQVPTTFYSLEQAEATFTQPEYKDAFLSIPEKTLTVDKSTNTAKEVVISKEQLRFYISEGMLSFEIPNTGITVQWNAAKEAKSWQIVQFMTERAIIALDAQYNKPDARDKLGNPGNIPLVVKIEQPSVSSILADPNAKRINAC